MQRGFPEVAELLGKGGKQFPCPARAYTWCDTTDPALVVSCTPVALSLLESGGHSGHHCRLIRCLCCCFFLWQGAGGSNQEQAGGSERTGGRRKCGISKKER